MTKKAQAAVTWIVIGIVALCPVPTRIAQPLKIQLVASDGRPVAGVRVYQNWQSFGLSGRGDATATTDALGVASFPARNAYGSIVTRFFGRAMPFIAVHSSYGATVRLEVTLPAPLEVAFRTPPFSPLEPFATSGSYRDQDGRIYWPQNTPGGQRVSVSGDFAQGADTLRFPLRKRTDPGSSMPP